MAAKKKLNPADAVRAMPTMTRTDGWENTLTGVGTRERDKQQALRFQRPHNLTFDWLTLQSLYHFDPLSRRIVDVWPKHMFRNGWDLATSSGSPLEQGKDGKPTAEDVANVEDAVEDMGLLEALMQGEIWGNLYGGALVLMGCNDGQEDLSKPLNEEGIKSIDYCNVVDRRYIQTSHYFSDYQQPNYGKPSVYRVFRSIVDYNDTNSKALFDIHASRVIRFEGTPVDVIERQRLGGWSHSVLQAPYEEIKRFMQTFQSASHLLTDASQGVYKLKGLMQKLATKQGQDLLYARMQMMDMARSVARSLLIDADGEEFQRIQTSFQSVPEMLDRFMQMLSMVTGIPVTLLMGRSAAGMNATGDSDFRAFYDEVAAKQRNELTPKLRRAYKLVTLAKNGPTKGKPITFKFDFRPLWNPTDKEKAEANYLQAQADEKWIVNQVASGDEIALSRFKNGRTNFGTWVDAAHREENLKDGVSFEQEPVFPTEGGQGPDTGASEPANQTTGASDGAATGGPGNSMGRALPDGTGVTNTGSTVKVTVTHKPAPPETLKPASKKKDELDDIRGNAILETLVHLDKAETHAVYQDLLQDYPSRALDWVLAAKWKKAKVELDDIDFTKRNKWRASHEPLDHHIGKIVQGKHKRAIMVKMPHNPKHLVVDGHHRTLAHEKLGRPVDAYVAEVHVNDGPWLQLHDMQKKGSGDGASILSSFLPEEFETDAEAKKSV